MNAEQVDAAAKALGEHWTALVEAEGIVGPITVGKAGRIRTIMEDAKSLHWTFGTFVDVARANRIVVTATAFHGKVGA